MSKIIEALINHLAYISKQKEKLPAALFPDSFSEREEFRKLLEDYMKGVDHHIQEG